MTDRIIESGKGRISRRAFVGGVTSGLLLAGGLSANASASTDYGQRYLSGNDRMTRQMECLDRGLVAVKVDEGVYIRWRLFGTDPERIGFYLFRDGELVNDSPITESTNYLDLDGKTSSTYFLWPVGTDEFHFPLESAEVWEKNYKEIPLKKPDDTVGHDGSTVTYSANDASVGDLTGDKSYDIVLKWDPSNSQDNAFDGYTSDVLIDAYQLDGTFMWRINLGKNVRAGAHYTQFLVYDFDGDGTSEVVMKTADGTVDGTGEVIGDPNADYRNDAGRILTGPEYLTVFDGETGEALATTDFKPERGDICQWGDCYGNRGDRFLACAAYLDGERPSIVMGRGYYEKTMLAAFDYRDGQITTRWVFDSDDPGNGEYAGQGNHNLSVADVDGDGKDEIVYGAMVIDHDGTGLYSTGWGHGDALHVGDFDPERPGLEVFQVHENSDDYGASFREAGTGELIWGEYTGEDTGRGMIADIDPNYLGAEGWASGVDCRTVEGRRISDPIPSINFGIWWTGDLQRELLDHNWNGDTGVGVGKIDKWDYENDELENLITFDGTYSNNGTKGNPCLSADILGDWREEVIWRTEDSTALRLYVTTDPTEHRIYTLMHNPQYRLSIAWQNVAYNQPPHPSFYLGTDMEEPPMPNIKLVCADET
jgi:rhamnogalacturonan exolyase